MRRRCNCPCAMGVKATLSPMSVTLPVNICVLPTVMAGLVPAIHVFSYHPAAQTWMPGIADKFTQSAKNRLLWPGMTNLGSALVNRERLILERFASTNPETGRLRD